MEIILGLIFILVLVKVFSPKKMAKSHGGGPMVMRSNNGYEGHLDFLEMHGCISPEERQAQRDFEEDYKKNPQNYKTTTLEELFKEEEDKQKSSKK